MQGRVTEGKIVHKGLVNKKFLQGEVHCWAFKLFGPEGHQLTATLYCLFTFLVLV